MERYRRTGHGDREMNCVICDDDATYNRAIVDTRDDVVVGGLCDRCERTLFGRCLSSGLWDDADGCFVCGGRGRFAMSLHEIDIRMKAGREHVEEGYGVGETTPLVCTRHLRAILDPDAWATVERRIRAKPTG
jgi:hypothetical protein